MSKDYLLLTGRAVDAALAHHESSPNVGYAKRVETLVAAECHVNVSDFKIRTRVRSLAYARFLIFAILWQPHGFRSLNWLGQRYGVSQWTVHYGVKRVHDTPELNTKYIKLMDKLVAQIEIEMFGSPTGRQVYDNYYAAQ